MATFKGNDGSEWTVAITYATQKRFKQEVGFDVFRLTESSNDSLPVLMSQLDRFFACLWICIEKQCIDKGITEESFGEILMGDSLEAAGDAFLDALTDFFPNPNQRQAIRNLIRKMKDAGVAIWKVQAEAIDQLDIAEVMLTQKGSTSKIAVSSA